MVFEKVKRSLSVARINVWNELKEFVQTLVQFSAMRWFIQRLVTNGVFGRSIWIKLAVIGDVEVLLPDGRSFHYHSSREDLVGRCLMWEGWSGYEPETSQVFFELAKISRLTMDIGANTGYFSLLACSANANSRIVAFEPLPFLYDRLALNVSLNGWVTRCDLRHEAVSSSLGRAIMHVPEGELPYTASLSAAWPQGKDGYDLSVDMVTIDSLLEEIPYVDLVKVDVEGMETDVLQGMRLTIEKHRPAIVVESLYNSDGERSDLGRFLAPFGYRFFHLRPEGPKLVDDVLPDDSRAYKNFLCLPDSERWRIHGDTL